MRAQLEMLMPSEFATSRIAMLEDRIRQLEDAEAMLRKLVMIMTSQIEARGQESASRVAAGGRQPATLTRRSNHGRSKVLVKPPPHLPPRGMARISLQRKTGA